MIEAIKALKTNPGVESLIVVANSGIVIKHENMGYRQAVQHAALVLDLCDKSKKFVGGLLDPPDVRAPPPPPPPLPRVRNTSARRLSPAPLCTPCLLTPSVLYLLTAQNQVESIRLRAQDTETGHQHEMIVAQTAQYTLIVLQSADDGKERKDEDDEDA